jgi:DNA repair protein RecO (recombination protein O)
VAGRTLETEAVVLRSLRYGEADRILHLYSEALGRIGAIAKGVRRTRSRFGGRLEPLSHVELVLHRGSGELATVTGVDLVRSHAPVREDLYRLNVGLVGAEAMLRLFPEQERSSRAFEALTRFLDLLDAHEPTPGVPRLDALGLAFQLKLLWVAGYLPHLSSCAECGGDGPLAGYSPRAGGVLCRSCAGADTLTLSGAGLAGMEALLRRPLAEAGAASLTARSAREVLSVVTSSYEHHGGFRLRTLSA